jgi:hypothetical protein
MAHPFWALPPLGLGLSAFNPTFGSFTLLGTGFTLCEPVSLVKVFRLFKLEQMFFGVQSVDTVGRCTPTSYLLAGPAFCDALLFPSEKALPPITKRRKASNK